jgi:hypothetical protein
MKKVASEPDPSRKAFREERGGEGGANILRVFLPLGHCHLYINFPIERSNGTGFPPAPPTGRKVCHLKGSGEISDTCHVSGALLFLKRK